MTDEDLLIEIYLREAQEIRDLLADPLIRELLGWTRPEAAC